MSGLRPRPDFPLYYRHSDKSGRRFPDKTSENPARSPLARIQSHQSLEILALCSPAVPLWRRDACSPVSRAVYPLCAPLGATIVSWSPAFSVLPGEIYCGGIVRPFVSKQNYSKSLAGIITKAGYTPLIEPG